MLPKRDGFAMLKAAPPARAIRTPVLMLTARDGVADKVDRASTSAPTTT